MTRDKKIIRALLALLVLAGITIAVLFAVLIFQPSTGVNQVHQQAYTAYAGSDGLLHTITGRVTAVGTNSITVVSTLPTANSKVTTYTVTISGDTKITEQKQRDASVVSAEMAVYQKKLASSKGHAIDPSTIPQPFEFDAITLNDMRENMIVNVTPEPNTSETAQVVPAQTITVTRMYMTGVE